MSDKPADKDRLHDLVVWGASGFVGRLVVEYLLAMYPPGGALRWAVAGRNQQKLEGLLDTSIGAGNRPSIVVGDSHDRDSLDRLARNTKVVLTTVGPYAQHGSELVEACVANGTDYCDLCGEVQWMREMIDRHELEAQRSGARIVMSCGFDSIPSDLGVFFLHMHARRTYQQPCDELAVLVRARGGVSGGTAASMLNTIAHATQSKAVRRILMDPYGLNPDGEREGPDGPNQRGARFNADAGEWTAPFIMSAVTTKVVRRTNALLGYPYGRTFRYSEATRCGPGVRGRCNAWILSAIQWLVLVACSIRPGRTILRRLLPKPGDGPTRQKRESGYFNFLLIGKQSNGESMRVRVAGDSDPGYGSTSKMLAESAVCLAMDDIVTRGGFWTPASAMGPALLERLSTNAGLSFELET